MSESNRQPTVSELAEAHVLGQLNDDQVDALNELLLRDADARKRCALTFETMSMVHEEFRRREENAEMHAGEPLLKDFDAVFSGLLQMEQNAKVALVSKPFEAKKKAARQRAGEAGSLSLRDYISVGGYALRKAVTSKPVIHAGMGAAAAAVLLLGLFLFNPFANDTPDPIAEATNSSDLSIDVPATLTNQVATLTATHNAAWSQNGAERALTRGPELHAGDRLTLTAGFAEITTNHGAIAILQAPATVELLDSNNALYLHSGKLVGICHTESSKGFVVKTDHAYITDLGTEFGVAIESERVIATVFTGEVEVTAPGGKPQSLTANQFASLQIDGNNRSFVIEDRLAQNFGALRAQMLTQTVVLPGTGQNLAVGEADPNWQIVAIDGEPLAEPVMANVADPASFETTVRKNLHYRANEPAVSQWVTALPAFDPLENVTYQTMFEISGTDPKSVSLDLRFIADLRVSEIELNGKAISVPQQGAGLDFTKLIPLAIKDGFVTGRNTLTVRVDRQPWQLQLGISRYWTGFRAELELTSRRSVAGGNP